MLYAQKISPSSTKDGQSAGKQEMNKKSLTDEYYSFIIACKTGGKPGTPPAKGFVPHARWAGRQGKSLCGRRVPGKPLGIEKGVGYMKKTFAALLAGLVLVMGLTACGQGSSQSSSGQTSFVDQGSGQSASASDSQSSESSSPANSQGSEPGAADRKSVV